MRKPNAMRAPSSQTPRLPTSIRNDRCQRSSTIQTSTIHDESRSFIQRTHVQIRQLKRSDLSLVRVGSREPRTQGGQKQSIGVNSAPWVTEMHSGFLLS